MRVVNFTVHRARGFRKAFVFFSICWTLLSVLNTVLPPLTTSVAAEESVSDYFTINYDPAVFSSVDIYGNDTFTVSIHGTATCIKDMPPVSEGVITGRIVARNTASGDEIILNSAYTLNINPFPNDVGESVEMTVTAPLQFSSGAVSDEYDVIAVTIEAEINLLGAWSDVTEYVPANKELGSLHYTAAGATPTPTSTVTATPSPTATATPFSTATVTSSTNATDTPQGQLFDVTVMLAEAALEKSDDLTVRIHFENFGTEPIPVDLTFTVLDESGEEVYETQDSTVVQIEANYVQKFFDLKLANGNYALVTKTLYNVNVSDEFRNNFSVGANGGFQWYYIVIALAVICALALTAGIAVFRSRVQKKKQDKRLHKQQQNQ